MEPSSRKSTTRLSKLLRERTALLVGLDPQTLQLHIEAGTATERKKLKVDLKKHLPKSLQLLIQGLQQLEEP